MANKKNVTKQEYQDMLEKIEGHLGGDWADEYPGIEKLKGAALIEALDAIIAELPKEEE